MTGVAGQEHTTAGPSRGQPRVEGVDGFSGNSTLRRRAVTTKKPLYYVGVRHPAWIIARNKLEFEAAGVVRARKRDAGAPHVAKDQCFLAGCRRILQINNEPFLIERLAIQAESKAGAD